ncbi:MAG: M20 family metallopeptidase, partial [Candidatus Zixiibacteriota bacterium]
MQNTLDGKIQSLAYDLHKKAIVMRRDLHRIPETAWDEHKTSAYLKKVLKSNGIKFKSIAKTGIMAEITSGKGKCAALRTDIDALPIEEQTGYPFKSTHPGRMHACGHDMHMATVTTAAIMLSRLKEQFHGSVKILYQPSEEAPPGGALRMIQEGALERPKVDMIFGLHVAPGYPTGTVAIRDGAFFAGVVDFDIIITGIGGHGAIPHRAVDPIVCGSAIVTALQTIVSRNVDPFEPAVVTIGRIEGGTARNIIPPICRLEGTARGQSTKTLNLLKKRIAMIVSQTARSYDCKAEIEYIA